MATPEITPARMRELAKGHDADARYYERHRDAAAYAHATETAAALRAAARYREALEEVAASNHVPERAMYELGSGGNISIQPAYDEPKHDAWEAWDIARAALETKTP